MDYIVKLYEDSLARNRQVLAQSMPDVNGKDSAVEIASNLMEASQKNLIGKWKTGKKYLRTVSAMRAIENYPMEIVGQSVNLDATVNCLDDLLDEKFTKEERGLYVVELLRLMSDSYSLDTSKSVRSKIDEYYHKLIGVAVLEGLYYGKIKDSESESEILANARSLYGVRSTDMDIFLELPLYTLGKDGKYIDEVVSTGRVFRTLNLISKDIDDYEHDKSMGQDTIFTIMSDRPESLRAVCDLLVGDYVADLNGASHDLKRSNLYRMIIAEGSNIQAKLPNLYKKTI